MTFIEAILESLHHDDLCSAWECVEFDKWIREKKKREQAMKID